VTFAGFVVGKRSGLTPIESLNTGFTLLARGEFSIIIVNLAIAGGLMPLLQPFAALYVLILASASPLLAKESERIYDISLRLYSWFRPNVEEEDSEHEGSLEEKSRPNDDPKNSDRT
jgi:CPA2 family monovalent cation:H+ antiporter-2